MTRVLSGLTCIWSAFLDMLSAYRTAISLHFSSPHDISLKFGPSNRDFSGVRVKFKS